MGKTTGTLGRCVGDEATFADRYWGREPFLHRRVGARFDDLLSLEDVDHLVTGTLLRLPVVRLVKDGRPLPPSSYTRTITVGARRVPETIRPERVLAAFADGATIVLQVLHRAWTPVARFCRELELAMTHPVQANAYVTPASSRGFSVHQDEHDVFVLQTHGRKAWRVYPRVGYGDEEPRTLDKAAPGAPVLEEELRPGDALYIPRGFPHDAVARDEVSVHLTVGIQARTWMDVWRHVMRGADDHPAFRDPLPLRFAANAGSLAEEMAARSDELARWLEKSVGPDAAASFARDYWTRRRPILDGQLLQVAALDRIGPDTPLRLRAASIFDVAVEGEEAIVRLGNRELRMPAFVEAALRYIAESPGRFAPSDLPGGLDHESRLVLVKRLVREGALRIADDGG
jgi:hypothetical protein